MSQTYAKYCLTISAVALFFAPLYVMGQTPEDGQWTMPAKDYASTRYSGLGPDHRRECHAAAPGVDILHRRARRPRRAAARGEEHHVRGHAVAERAVRVRPHQGRLSAQVEVPSGREPERDRHLLLRRRSIAARSTPTARSSTTCSTGTPSRWTRRRARSCGRRRSPTCARARRRRWRRSWSRIASSSAPPAASSASTAG